RANEAVRSELATPRTPSVPNFTTTILPDSHRHHPTEPVPAAREPASGGASALGELLGLAGLDEAVLLGLLLPRVAGEQSGLLQGGPGLGLGLGERAGEGHAHRPGLAADAATGDRGVDVETLGGLEDPQRLDGLHAVG